MLKELRLQSLALTFSHSSSPFLSLHLVFSIALSFLSLSLSISVHLISFLSPSPFLFISPTFTHLAPTSVLRRINRAALGAPSYRFLSSDRNSPSSVDVLRSHYLERVFGRAHS